MTSRAETSLERISLASSTALEKQSSSAAAASAVIDAPPATAVTIALVPAALMKSRRSTLSGIIRGIE